MKAQRKRKNQELYTVLMMNSKLKMICILFYRNKKELLPKECLKINKIKNFRIQILIIYNKISFKNSKITKRYIRISKFHIFPNNNQYNKCHTLIQLYSLKHNRYNNSKCLEICTHQITQLTHNNLIIRIV